MLSDGYHDVPVGKIAMVVTYLEMTEKPTAKPVGTSVGWNLSRIETPDRNWYRALFRKVGQEWLWFERLCMDDAELESILSNPKVHIYTLRKSGTDGALLELDFRVPGACELAYFGLTAELIGSGVGRFLMNAAIDLAWNEPINRFHVHTCTLDSPQALGFYRRSGFTPIQQKIEIADDPRLAHGFDRSSGTHVPVFDF